MDIQDLIILDSFNPGAVRDTIDERDYQFHEIAYGAAPFDWNAGYDIETLLAEKLPVKDQGQSGSCGGQAWANYGDALTLAFDKNLIERSAKFIYSQTFVSGGGSAGRPNCEIVINQGWGTEALTSSYENGKPPSEAFMERPQDITDAARNTAKLDTALAYANVTTSSIDEVAQAIQMNHGVILGVDGCNNGTWLSANPQPPVNNNGLWGHWLYAGKARIVNGVKEIGVLNSWGTSVGEQGWQWLSENYFKSGYIFSAWTLIFNTNKPVKPTHVFETNLSKGQTSSEVQLLQQALQYLGFFPASVAPTQYYGVVTTAAVLKFQKAHDIVDDGTHFGPQTRAALNAALK